MAEDKPPKPAATAKKAPAAKRPSPAPRPTAATAPPPPQRGPGRPSNAQVFVDQLAGMFAVLGTSVCVIDQFDGMTIVANAYPLAESIGKVAESNPAVKRALSAMVSTSDYFGVVTAVSAIALPILGNHGVLPASFRAMSPTALAHVGEAVEPDAPTGLAALGQLFAVPDRAAA